MGALATIRCSSISDSGKRVAEMDPAEKNRRSHRQAALQRLLALLAGAD